MYIVTCRDTKKSEYAEECVRYISENAIPESMSLDEICESTNRDTGLQNVIECVESDQWCKYKKDQSTDIFTRLREELTVRKMPNGSEIFFLHQTSSCTSSICLQHVFKVLKKWLS